MSVPQTLQSIQLQVSEGWIEEFGDEFATAIEVLGACSGELPGSYGVTKQGNHRTLKW